MFFVFFAFFFFFLFLFLFFHFLDFSFFLFLFSFIFLVLLSFSFIFFFFVGCSKSDFFFWASISLRFLLTTLVSKNQFLGPSRRYPSPSPLGPLFLCFLLFSNFFSGWVFLAFYFSFFSFLVTFFFFRIFSVFHVLFLCFLKKKVSSFLFSCMSFKYVYSLVLESEFNCFLHSRCSMEMWCPDDTGRDSWDWVGPPAWRRAT